MKELLSVLATIAKDTASFYGCLVYFLFGKPFATCPYFITDPNTNKEDEYLSKLHAKVHIYSLAIAFYLYDKKHYRKDSYREDIVDNFRNVAVPGTGIPLSFFVQNKYLAYFLVFVLYPLICFVASIHWYYLQCKKENNDVPLSCISEEFAIRLLTPDDWFSYWRLNSRLAGYHAYLHNISDGYHMENKWTFLQEGVKRSVPVSPFLSELSNLVIKHKNEEGGLGIYFYKNAVHGGDWIIQERMYNSDWVSSLLPKNAPLSTFRVMTSSRLSISMENIKYDETNTCPDRNVIQALSCVFRAGREGAKTDHDSILFDVDIKTGTIRYGTTSAHWYKLGTSILNTSTSLRSNGQEHTTHPDAQDITITDKVIPDMASILKLVEDCHFKMCPDVPFVGWDVVLSTNESVPVCLLEVNLSCNFFRGSFDKKVYLEFCRDLCTNLDGMKQDKGVEGKKDN